jgi:hypothetical protein
MPPLDWKVILPKPVTTPISDQIQHNITPQHNAFFERSTHRTAGQTCEAPCPVLLVVEPLSVQLQARGRSSGLRNTRRRTHCHTTQCHKSHRNRSPLGYSSTHWACLSLPSKSRNLDVLQDCVLMVTFIGHFSGPSATHHVLRAIEVSQHAQSVVLEQFLHAHVHAVARSSLQLPCKYPELNPCRISCTHLYHTVR